MTARTDSVSAAFLRRYMLGKLRLVELFFPVLTALGLPLVAEASSELDLTGGLRAEYHDNLARVADNKESDVDRVTSLNVVYGLDESGVLLNLDYDAEYHDYLHDSEEDETAINGQADLRWQLIPRHLDFVLTHQASQELSDRRGADVSDNREMRSVLSTGVDWISDLSNVDSIVVSPRFIDVRFEESDGSDSQHSVLGASWQRRVSQVSQLSVSGSYADVQFDDGTNNYESSSLLLGFATALSRLSYQLAVGVNQFDREVGDDLDGPLVRAGIDYDGGATVWSGSLVHELTDSSIGLAGDGMVLEGVVPDDGNFEEFDVVERTKLDVAVRHNLNDVHGVGLGISARNDDYQDTLRDERGYIVTANYRYALNRYWSFDVGVRAGKTEFLDDPGDLEYDETLVRGSARYQHSQALLVEFSLIREERDASDDLRSYTDNIAVIGINYQFF